MHTMTICLLSLSGCSRNGAAVPSSLFDASSFHQHHTNGKTHTLGPSGNLLYAGRHKACKFQGDAQQNLGLATPQSQVLERPMDEEWSQLKQLAQAGLPPGPSLEPKRAVEPAQELPGARLEPTREVELASLQRQGWPGRVSKCEALTGEVRKWTVLTLAQAPTQEPSEEMGRASYTMPKANSTRGLRNHVHTMQYSYLHLEIPTTPHRLRLKA